MLSPLLKYPGGKTKELKYIIPALPRSIKKYYEPFVGGGAVYFQMPSTIQNPQQYYINDRSHELMSLYQSVANQDDDFKKTILEMDSSWKGVDVFVQQNMESLKELMELGMKIADPKIRKMHFVDSLKNMKSNMVFAPKMFDAATFFKDIPVSLARKAAFLSKKADEDILISDADFEDIITTAFKSSIYVHYRDAFNDMSVFPLGVQAALYLFIRQYAYSSMFRYSKTGKFNVPYGGKSYNNIMMASKIEYFESEELQNLLTKTVMGNMDFETFMDNHTPEPGDFIFLDPPYDTDFSTYANNEFGQSEQERLADYLIHKTAANWMMIIKSTDLINSLYPESVDAANGQKIHVTGFDKSYGVNFMNRNEKDVEHLIITNYQLPNLEL
ncbi:DNA adenine methylase [Weissella confusa]|uniref:site-specific DNA-methyltransferase (adenine-specific) n=1 Tax=Weissella fermenti TaxID=2987699 RepID=A0ABT6D4N1_9LACO|nr:MULTISPECIES: DNA adenine methylase [Weissella]MBJ7689335.1 DNA adenine methylase [Weissella confusa]MCW0925956.1 DNA adenine methylase [Weissella sp. LMG 11983]MDF9300494.1 DNA adenine methylase [Weissella sp. BK2]